ncbi:vicilin-like antimicrobial peptides 2-2 [Phtheirospermum japonicum]|uniref:Vicilin-like antimicrobial peptides 2-2 n=1 Tax=Phtheirospermum japonicum TaxID=374723 RepID=A0A830B9S0_9LAMI|nr:vicilin-like antimicrobial peptides 2-2 [Phtheirospermum japonicum]
MSKKSYFISVRPVEAPFLWCAILVLTIITTGVHAEASGEGGIRASGPLVKREQRKTLFSSEDGQISAARVADNIDGSYLLHFFTLEPNSLFLPALLHADMVFYVHTGSGKLSWTDEDELKSTEITRGDVYRLEQGSFFFIHSNLETETERQKLRIHAIFVDSNNDLHEPATGPYSSIRDMVLGFDREVLKAAFKVPEEVIDDLLNGTSPPAIIHGLPKTKKAAFEMEAQFVRSILGTGSYKIFELNKKKKRSSVKLYNLFKEDKDFENCNGWSTTVTRKKLSALKGSDVGLFMVNLTAGSMMGPHWNPAATEVAVVLQGRGMVRVVCSSCTNETRCRNRRFEVEEGDVFAVPKFHPMAQISFNNGTLVFMGFSTSAKKNHPQFLAGQASVFRSLDKDVLAMSFNVTNTTLDQLLAPQHESVILGCVSCADEELRIMEEEKEKETKRREEERKREEEEARKREEEAAKREEEDRRRKQEEEEAEARRKEEEKEREREGEAAKREKEEEERQREEEAEAARREEAKRREEEERERREEEERQREEQEEAKRREKEQEEARQREEEQAEAKRREEEQAEARQREEEQEEEQETQRQEEQEEARRKRQEQEEARRREEQQEEGGKSEGERAAEEERRREEEAQREEEEQRGRGQEGENRGWGKILKKRLTV